MSADQPPQHFCTIAEFCKMTGLGKTSVYAMLGRGEITAIKVGTRTLLPVADNLEKIRNRPSAKFTAPRL